MFLGLKEVKVKVKVKEDVVMAKYKDVNADNFYEMICEPVSYVVTWDV